MPAELLGLDAGLISRFAAVPFAKLGRVAQNLARAFAYPDAKGPSSAAGGGG